MQIKNKPDDGATNALLAMFPHQRSFSEFKTSIAKMAESDAKIGRVIFRILQYACKNGVIEAETETAFTAFIESQGKRLIQSDVSAGYEFKDLLEEITENRSVNQLINALNRITQRFEMPDIQASMFTRLKKDFNPNTVIKRNCLRVLAFWLGRHHPLAGWNYEKLIALAEQPLYDIDTKAGVRLAFNIEGKGDIIHPQAVAWLRKELEECIKNLQLYHINPKEQFDYSSATVFLNLYKEKGALGEPRLYQRSIRDALALAHQIAVRWDLYCVRQKVQNSLQIGVAAGRYNHLDTQIQALITVRLPENHVIRLTSFAHLCSRIADIKVVYFKNPTNVELPGGNITTAWSVDCFWVFIYYDFIPDLLEEEMLPTGNDSASYEAFRNALYFSQNGVRHKALAAMHQFPHNTLLILEIAKVCAARRMFHEADAILATLLASEPRHVVARTFRLFICLNLALIQSDFEIAALFFDRAIEEGDYIMNQCGVEEEEFFCEYGLVYFGLALRIFTILRSGGRITKPAEERDKEQDKEGNKNEDEKICLNQDIDRALEALEKAEKLFQSGRAVSATGIGNRTVYWLINTTCLRELLQRNRKAFTTLETLRDINNTWDQKGQKFFIYLGWMDPARKDMIEKRIEEAIKTYQESVLLRTYIPNIKYAFATVLYDFSPVLTVGIIKKVLYFLEQARETASKLSDDNVAIYSIATCFSQLQEAGEFIRCVKRSIQAIQDEMKLYFKDKSDPNFLNYDDDYEIKRKKLSGMKLMLLNLDEIYGLKD